MGVMETDVQEQHAQLQREIDQLRREKDAVLLAHNYQLPEVQDVADFVGDSLALARYATQCQAQRIVLCGVAFMAETAAILAPDKQVLLPDLEAGCSLADSITPQQLAEWKAEHPDAVVVSYVNTSAAVKALSDYCCTSSNAVDVVHAIDPQREILFLPDFFLGSYVRRVTGRTNLHIWMGECHVHASILPEEMERRLEDHPDAQLLVHPECGCTTRALALPPQGREVRVLSTDAMLQHAKASTAQQFIVATEVGMLYRLSKENPQKAFLPADEQAICPFMKRITLQKVRDALANERYEIRLDPQIRERALLPLQRMVAIGGRPTNAE